MAEPINKDFIFTDRQKRLGWDIRPHRSAEREWWMLTLNGERIHIFPAELSSTGLRLEIQTEIDRCERQYEENTQIFGNALSQLNILRSLFKKTAAELRSRAVHKPSRLLERFENDLDRIADDLSKEQQKFISQYIRPGY